MQPALQRDMRLQNVWTQKRTISRWMPGSCSAACRTCPPSSSPAPYQEEFPSSALTLSALGPGTSPRVQLLKAPSVLQVLWLSCGSSAPGLSSSTAAPLRAATSTWMHFSGASPMAIGSFDSLHSLSPLQVFLNYLPGFFSSTWTAV